VLYDKQFSIQFKFCVNKMDQILNYGMKAFSGNSSGNAGMNPFNILANFDRNGDGSITEDDFVLAAQQYGLGPVGEFAVRAAFKEIDTNHNGKLELMEAVKAFRRLEALLGKLNGGQPQAQ
jgi:Ca2+-binding EF-hand superfamily protein